MNTNVFYTDLSSNQEKENRLTLDLLGAIEQKGDVSQRHLAQHMGVALGMANSYLKRCVKKGWVKITTAPANRYLYYLTPKGFAEKSRLTGEFLTTSLALVRQSGEAYTDFFESLQNRNKPIVFVGLSDLTEMAYLRALKLQLNTVGVFVPAIEDVVEPSSVLPDEWFGMPVIELLPEAWEEAIFVFTSLDRGYQLAKFMQLKYPHCELFIPEFLSLIPAEPDMPDSDAEQVIKH